MHLELHSTESSLACWGGEGVLVEDLACGLRALGHTALIVARIPVGSPAASDENRVSVPVQELYARLGPTRALRIHREALALLADRPTPDRVLLMGLDSWSVARSRSLQAGAPLFYFANLPFILHRYAEGAGGLNCTWRWTGRTDQLAALEQRLFETADRVVVPGPSTARLLEKTCGVSPHRLLVVPHFIDLPTAPSRAAPSLPLARSQGTASVLFVGRLVPQKGLQVLFEAVSRLRDAGRDVRLIVVGSGEREEREPAFYAGRPGREAVVFLGRLLRADLPALYDSADVVAVPSLYEPGGLVCREAMARSRPVVATAVDGLCEAIEHRRTGLLVPVTEPAPWCREICPDALAGALREVLDDPEAARQMGQRARRSFETHWQSPSIVEPLLRAL